MTFVPGSPERYLAPGQASGSEQSFQNSVRDSVAQTLRETLPDVYLPQNVFRPEISIIYREHSLAKANINATNFPLLVITDQDRLELEPVEITIFKPTFKERLFLIQDTVYQSDFDAYLIEDGRIEDGRPPRISFIPKKRRNSMFTDLGPCRDIPLVADPHYPEIEVLVLVDLADRTRLLTSATVKL